MVNPLRYDTTRGIVWCSGLNKKRQPCNNRTDTGKVEREPWYCIRHQDQDPHRKKAS